MTCRSSSCRLRVGQEAKVGYSSGSGSFELAVDVEQFAQRMRLALKYKLGFVNLQKIALSSPLHPQPHNKTI